MNQAVETATGAALRAEHVPSVRGRRGGEDGGSDESETGFVARLGAMLVGGFLPAEEARESLTHRAGAGDPTARQRVEAEYREQLTDEPLGHGGLAEQAAEQLTRPAGGGPAAPNASDPVTSREPVRADRVQTDRGADNQPRAEARGSQASEGAPPRTESAPEQPQNGAARTDGQSARAAQAGAAAQAEPARPHGTAATARAAAARVAGATAKPGAAQPVHGTTGKNGASVRNGVRAPRATPRPASPYRMEQQVRAQVERGLAAVLRQRGGSVTLRLTPAALGELRVKMTVNGARVEAGFEPATKQAQRLLEQNLSALRSALEAKGLAVERLHVADAPEAHAGGGAAGDSSERAREGPGGGARSGTAGAGGASGGEDAREGQLAGAPEDAGIIDIGGAVIRIDTLA